MESGLPPKAVLSVQREAEVFKRAMAYGYVHGTKELIARELGSTSRPSPGTSGRPSEG